MLNPNPPNTNPPPNTPTSYLATELRPMSVPFILPTNILQFYFKIIYTYSYKEK